jgi:signal transduction histidine kinase
MEIRTKDGRPAILDISACRILQDGRAAALQYIARDITEHKAAETALTEAHRQLESTHAELRRLHEQLERIHASLAREIAERQRAQAELERVHKQLLTTAREAGMAEVSTGVLHNTANVLNSINVSANRVVESLRTSRAENLARVSALLREHAGDLEAFVNGDEKGRQIGVYIENLAAYLADERTALLAEFVSLRKNVDHVSIVIATQQNYTSTGGVRERVALAELVHDALKVAEPLFERHGVALRREFAELPVVNLDRHQVMQVLVNLLRNAAYACAESGRDLKEVAVRIAPRDGARFEIEVADNGIGIPAGNLTRIFNQGFTTRKDGHGFGLHSSVLAAQAMGGTLTVHSEGTGCGATFKLELPLDASRKEESAA